MSRNLKQAKLSVISEINKILKDLDEAQKQKDNTEKAKDQASLNVGAGTGGRQTSDFIEDLKDAYKAGIYTGGTKTKEFMAKYNLDPSDILKLILSNAFLKSSVEFFLSLLTISNCFLYNGFNSSFNASATLLLIF